MIRLGLACAVLLAVACDDADRSGAVTEDAAASSAVGAGGRGAGGATPSTSRASSGPSASTGTGGAGGDTAPSGTGGGGAPPIDLGPEPYPAGRVHSPITEHVAAHIREVIAPSASAESDVFMKVGASSTVAASTLFCFAGASVDLGEHQDLGGTLAFFLAGDAAGTSPFARESLAAEVGRTASWAMAGDPSPLEQELAAIDPRIALVHYGTNDMGAGATYESALVAFHENLGALVRTLEAEGIVPILFGITRRGDDAAAQRWVATFNAAIRGIAQREQTPFVDLFEAIDPLAGHGLGGDGLHLEAYDEGACILDDAGLEHGYNVRNLVALEALDRVRRAAYSDDPAPDAPLSPLEGDGSDAAPWRIGALPFSHAADTQGGARGVDGYPACGSDADESGPERWYTLELPAARRVRAVVLDEGGVDVDIHLIGASPDACVARGHHTVEAALGAGTYHVVVDSWVDDEGIEKSGAYTLVVVECDDDDDACGTSP